MILASEDNQLISYWYEGICPYSGGLVRLPRTLEIEAIARQLMQELEQGYEKIAVKPCSTEIFPVMEGKMYGVLLAESVTGEKLVLKAFSGLLNGKSLLEGWVPPIAGREKVAIEESITLNQLAVIKQELIQLSEISERLEYTQKSQAYAMQLQALRDRHQVSKQARQAKRSQLLATVTGTELELALKELEGESQREKMTRRNFKRDRDQVLLPLLEFIKAADDKMQMLKAQRRELSRTLQTQMHNAYVLTNFAGETRSLRELITEGTMPTGMGDCCAPKLLHYAATHHLKPLAMAEFWWGSPSPDGYKIQGEFYGACAERCQPLMGFLLSGRRSSLTPLKKGGKENSVLTKGGEENSAIFMEGTENQVSLFKGDLGGSIPLIYEDSYLLAISKPAGLLSVPGRYLDTQDSALSRLQQNLGETSPLYPVHRLDRQTSGILVFARDLESLRHLSAQFQQKEIHKIYEAILSGKLEQQEGLIDLPLWGNPENRPHQQVDFQRGKPSITKFRVLAYQDKYSHIEFTPLTGRTHQLRVHSADPRGLGMPILGDRLYGCQAATDRLHLHAKELTFRHPRSLELIHLQVAVPF